MKARRVVIMGFILTVAIAPAMVFAPPLAPAQTIIPIEIPQPIYERSDSYVIIHLKDRAHNPTAPDVLCYRIDDEVTKQRLLKDSILQSPNTADIELAIPGVANRIATQKNDYSEELHTISVAAIKNSRVMYGKATFPVRRLKFKPALPVLPTPTP